MEHHSAQSSSAWLETNVMAAFDVGCSRTSRPHWYAYALVKGSASYGKVFTPPFFFPSCPLSLLSSFALLSSSLPFHQPITTNHDLHPHLIQTLYLRVGHSTPLRKTLTVNHYLRIEYFQHPPCVHPLDTKTFALVGGRKSITALVQWAEPENLCPKRPWDKIMGRVKTFGPTPSFTLNLVKNGRFQTGNS